MTVHTEPSGPAASTAWPRTRTGPGPTATVVLGRDDLGEAPPQKAARPESGEVHASTPFISRTMFPA